MWKQLFKLDIGILKAVWNQVFVYFDTAGLTLVRAFGARGSQNVAMFEGFCGHLLNIWIWAPKIG